MNINRKKVWKAVGWIVASPFLLFLLLAILLYLPPVQNFVAGRMCEAMSESTGLDIRIGYVRLGFPLDLVVDDLHVTEDDSLVCDARTIRLEVAVLPLFEGRADIDGLRLREAKIDTRSLIADTRVSGDVRLFDAELHGVEWAREKVHLDEAVLADANLAVVLTDTAAEDTTTSTAKWDIVTDRVTLRHTAVAVSLPGDTMRIAAALGKAELLDGHFDTGRPYYAFRRLTIEDGFVHYDAGTNTRPAGRLAPEPKSLAAALAPLSERARGSSLTLPTRPLDINHIAISDLGTVIDTLSYDEAGRLRCGVRHLRMKERCGLSVEELSGSVYLDTLRLRVPALTLLTPSSRINAGIAMDWASLSPGGDGRMSIDVDAHIGHSDILTLGDGFVDKAMLRALPAVPLNIAGTFTGNLDDLTISRLRIALPGIATLNANGRLRHATTPWRSGSLRLNARTQNLACVRRLLPREITQQVHLPDAMTLAGSVAFAANDYRGDLTLGTGGGSLHAKAHANLKGEHYDIKANAARFPLQAFLPGMGLSNFTGTLSAVGHGFDPTARGAACHARADIRRFRYATYPLDGINLDADLSGGKAVGTFSANNPLLRGRGAFDAVLSPSIEAALKANIESLDLRALGATTDTLYLGGNIDIKARCSKDMRHIAAEGLVGDIRLQDNTRAVMTRDLYFDFASAPDTTAAHINSGDLALALTAGDEVGTLAQHASTLIDMLMAQIDRRALDQEALRHAMFPLDFTLRAGQDNPLAGLLRLKGTTLSTLDVSLHTSPISGLSGYALAGPIVTGNMQLDTTNVEILQDTTGIKFNARVHNYLKSNPNKFDASIKSYLLSSGAGADILFVDEQGDTGIDLGVRADIVEQGINVSLYPKNPTIAYRGFTLNKDNYIFLGKDKSIRANIDLLADDGTGLKLYGEPNADTGENDLTLSISQLNLTELSSVLPFLPSFNGMLSGDVHVTMSEDNLSAAVDAEAKGFKYEGVDLGDIGIEAFYLPKEGGEHHANAFISQAGSEVAEVEGSYFEADGGSYDGTLRLHDFPLQMLNGFLVGTDMALRGDAQGDFHLHGTVEHPTLDGQLDMGGAHIYSDVYGFDFRMDDRPVRIDRSTITFDKYGLYSTGEKPLLINGSVNAQNIDAIALNLTMRAKDFELINTEKKRESMIYGKVFTDFFGSVSGTLGDMVIRGKLNVLDRTDVTYILKDSPLTVEDRLSDLVTFVNFADTTAVETPREPESTMDLTLNIALNEAARAHCLLSEDGESYVNLEGGGDLTMRLTKQGEMRMTGRYTVQQGEMKYALPVIPLKTFAIDPGSYVDFTGEMLNPTLNIAAKERVKAVVTDGDQQRSVAFNVGVALTKPLEEMGLEFTIEAPEDLSVQNELAAMTAEQRGKTAVALLATGMYMTDANMASGTGFKASNALNAFLQNEIQQIAGNALKTIDISLGVESGTSAVGTTTTDYSFQFSKRFLDDRISVIVGGKISTGVDATNSAESFINNVSVEYRLDKSATRYVRVFYDRSAQDPLEGQLMKTGAGLVLRRKTDRLGELFIFSNKKKAKTTK